MKTWLSRFASLAIFLLGLLAGVALTVLWVGGKVRRLADEGPGAFARAGIERATRRLDLDATQREEFASALEQMQAGFTRMHEEDMARTRTLIERAVAEMRPRLRPEQQEKLDAMLEASRRRWTKFLGPWPGPTESPNSAL